MSENQGKTVVEIDAEEIKKLGWEHGKASGGQLPGHGGIDLRDAVVEQPESGYEPEHAWTPGEASGTLMHAYGSQNFVGVAASCSQALEEATRELAQRQETENKITENLVARAEKERLKREGK